MREPDCSKCKGECFLDCDEMKSESAVKPMKNYEKFEFFTEDTLKMVSEKEAEALAKKACEEYMTNCNLQNINDAQLASQKMLAMAHELFETMHDGDMKMDTVQ